MAEPYPKPVQGAPVAYPAGLFDLAAEAGRMGLNHVAKSLPDVVDASTPIKHCARLEWADRNTREWLEHYAAINAGLRAPVTAAPLWYNGHMITLHAVFLDAERGKAEAIQEMNGKRSK